MASTGQTATRFIRRQRRSKPPHPADRAGDL